MGRGFGVLAFSVEVFLNACFVPAPLPLGARLDSASALAPDWLIHGVNMVVSSALAWFPVLRVPHGVAVCRHAFFP